VRFTSLPGVLILVATGCTGTDPDDAGTFTAHLTGVAALTFTGPTDASMVYTADAPDGQFTIRMFQVEQGINRGITISCPGQVPPPPGSHSLAPEGRRLQWPLHALHPGAAGHPGRGGAGVRQL